MIALPVSRQGVPGNETAELESLGENNYRWLENQCKNLNRELRWKLWKHSDNHTKSVENREKAVRSSGC